MTNQECFLAELCATTATGYQQVWTDCKNAETRAQGLAANLPEDPAIALLVAEEAGAIAIDANVNRHELPGVARRAAARIEGGCGDQCTLVKLAQRLDTQNQQ